MSLVRRSPAPPSSRRSAMSPAASAGRRSSLLTALLNARHVLYSAALAPWFAGRPRRRAGGDGPRPDRRGVRALDRPLPPARAGRRLRLLVAAIVATFIPWNLATLAGVTSARRSPIRRGSGIDVIFPAAMAGLAVGLISGRRELVAAVAGRRDRGRRLAAVSPSVGIVAGGVLGPVRRAARPAREGPGGGAARHRRPRRERYSMPDACRSRYPTSPDRSSGAGAAAMSTDLVPLAVLMWAVTYPSRAIGLLAPGMHRLPRPALDYLQLVGPAVLAAIAHRQHALPDAPAPPGRGRDRVGVRRRLHRPRRVAAEPVPRTGRGGRHRDRGPRVRPRLTVGGA